jgi:26S proteasome regulatory subunit N5
VFSPKDEAGQKRWSELHKRVIEHNIRVIAKYYTRITTKRLTQLLDLNEQVRYCWFGYLHLHMLAAN